MTMEPKMSLTEAFRSHPFRVLSATPRDPRDTLIRRQGDMALFGDEAAASRALAELLHPESRLEAEIRWFPRTDQALIDRLFAWVEDRRIDKALPRFVLASHLANFNFVRLILTALPIQSSAQLHAVLQSLSVAADTLLPGQVLEEINDDRRQAGFALLTDAGDLRPRLRGLLTETVRYFITCAGPYPVISARTLSQKLKQEYTDRSSPFHNSFLLRIAADELKQLR